MMKLVKMKIMLFLFLLTTACGVADGPSNQERVTSLQPNMKPLVPNVFWINRSDFSVSSNDTLQVGLEKLLKEHPNTEVSDVEIVYGGADDWPIRIEGYYITLRSTK